MEVPQRLGLPQTSNMEVPSRARDVQVCAKQSSSRCRSGKGPRERSICSSSSRGGYHLLAQHSMGCSSSRSSSSCSSICRCRRSGCGGGSIGGSHPDVPVVSCLPPRGARGSSSSRPQSPRCSRGQHFDSSKCSRSSSSSMGCYRVRRRSSKSSSGSRFDDVSAVSDSPPRSSLPRGRWGGPRCS